MGIQLHLWDFSSTMGRKLSEAPEQLQAPKMHADRIDGIKKNPLKGCSWIAAKNHFGLHFEALPLLTCHCFPALRINMHGTAEVTISQLWPL